MDAHGRFANRPYPFTGPQLGRFANRPYP